MDAPVAPIAFLDRLEDTFQGRLRLRWSPKRSVWAIEQRVGRAALAPLRRDPFDDSVVLARDGYTQVMAFAPTNYCFCAFCGRKLAVPLFTSQEIRCEACMAANKDARWRAAYFPLGERLLDHLKMLDPERQDIRERVAREEAASLLAKDRLNNANHREAREQLKDGLLDQLPIAGFPSLTPDGWRH